MDRFTCNSLLLPNSAQKSIARSPFLCLLAAFWLWTLGLGLPTVGLAMPATVENDSATCLVNTPVIVDLLVNDSGNWVGGTLSQPLQGTAVGLGNGVIGYTPDTDFIGIDAASCTLTDYSWEILRAKVVITVGATPVPVAQDDFATIQRNNSVTIDVSANDSGDWVSGALSQPLQGTAVGLRTIAATG